MLTGFALSEIDRRLTQIIRLGRIVEVDAAKARVRVKLGENTTGWRPWVTCAGAIKVWNPPAVGEQVVLLSPGGDLDQSIVLPSLYYRSFAAPSQDPQAVQVQLSEETTAVWNPIANTLSLDLPPEGHIEFKSGDLSAYFDSREVTFMAPDTSFCFEDGGAALISFTNRFDLSPEGIQLAAGDTEVRLSKGATRIKGKGVELNLSEDAATLSVAGQTLVLNANGLFLNGRPL